MTSSFVNPTLAAEPTLTHFKTAILEPLLITGAALFWVLALPVVAVSLMAVKIWEVLVALSLGNAVRHNPLILRQGPLKGKVTRRISHIAPV
jgi:hypothetical protein